MNISATTSINVAPVDGVEASLSQRDRVRLKLTGPVGEVVIHMTPHEAANMVSLLESLIQLYRGSTTT